MGLSITASIAYGCWYNPDEDDLPWLDALLDEDDDFDFEAIIARKAGIGPMDYSAYPERSDYVDAGATYLSRNEAYQTAVEEWREANNADEHYARQREAVAAAPLDLDYAGHGDNPIYVIHIRGQRFESYWSPEPVPDTWTIDDKDVARARAFADELGIPWDAPDWLLYPYYSH